LVQVVARLVRVRLAVRRGVLYIPCSQGHWLAGIFGNDNYTAEEQVQREVEALRRTLQASDFEELGFSVSRDGFTWVLLIRPIEHESETEAGNAFRREMKKYELQEILCKHWPRDFGRDESEAPAGANPPNSEHQTPGS
jgi:hypothetical protein